MIPEGWNRTHEDQMADHDKATGTTRGFLDGTRITPGTEGCNCGPDCEFPCWQRIGLTTQPCCPTCPPLED